MVKLNKNNYHPMVCQSDFNYTFLCVALKHKTFSHYIFVQILIHPYKIFLFCKITFLQNNFETIYNFV